MRVKREKEGYDISERADNYLNNPETRARREGAYRQRDDRLTFVTIDPLLEGFRQDPRYTDLPEEDASAEVG